MQCYRSHRWSAKYEGRIRRHIVRNTQLSHGPNTLITTTTRFPGWFRTAPTSIYPSKYVLKRRFACVYHSLYDSFLPFDFLLLRRSDILIRGFQNDAEMLRGTLRSSYAANSIKINQNYLHIFRVHALQTAIEWMKRECVRLVHRINY